MEGWIKLHRKTLEWEWYSDLPARVLFFHLLLRANFKETKWRGRPIGRGQVLTSIRKLASETGLSVKQIRVALGKLEATHELTQEATHKCSIITLCKYGTYQSQEEKEGTLEGTRKGTGGAQQHVKKERNKENIYTDFPVLDCKEFREAWELKLAHRAQLKQKAITPMGQRKQFATFAKWGVPKAIAAINLSIEKDWIGVFEVDTPNAPAPLVYELAEPIGWRDRLNDLKSKHPFDDDLARTNPSWDWKDIPSKIQKLIKDGTAA